MALKRKITKSVFEKLSEELKKEYKADGEDYILETEGDEDTGALKRAKDRETQKAKEEKERADKLQQDLDAITDKDARKAGDIATLERSWQKKVDDEKAASTAKIAKKDAFIKTALVDNVAMALASKLTKSPGLLLPHIKARITADLDGDTPTTRILDKDGKPSALTIDDLQKEFAANAEFAPIIIASKASGSGGAGNPPGLRSGGAPQNDDGKPAMLSSLTPEALAARITANKAASQT